MRLNNRRNILNRNKSNSTRNVGEIRQSQLISSYGIGSMVDFLKDTVIIAGVDDWNENDETLKLYNENLQSLTGVDYFIKPKTDTEGSNFKKSKDIPSYIFPEKLYCPNCKSIFDNSKIEIQKYQHKCPNPKCNCNNLIASRFVVICENGHMEDFPYSWWVHRGEECSSGKLNPRIEMYNIEDKSNIESLIIKCKECGCNRAIYPALQERALSGEKSYKCTCCNPHFKNPYYDKEKGCNATLKTRLRTSSSVYFPVIQSALSIPPWSREAVKIVIAKYDDIKWQEGRDLKRYIKERILPTASSNVSLDDLLKAYELVKNQKKNKKIRSLKDIYQDEYEELSKGESNKNDGEFSSFTVNTPNKYKKYIDKIVVVDRLTEVQALCGFTRLKSWDGSSLNDSKIVRLSMEKKNWLPAIKMNGEGIFVKFNEKQLDLWNEKISSRYNQLRKNYEQSEVKNLRFSNKYVLLHTFAHLLIRQISNECGYSVASLKDKIYSKFHDEAYGNLEMAGILIYLATSDSEGSLGGLINIAMDTEKIERIFDNMLENALWCSADPLCVNSTEQGYKSLNYAACHDCLLVPETTCEFRNIFLDRVSVVGTNENREIGLFGELL